jgi:hypothetical protein
MQQKAVLIITSLLSISFWTLHWADDIVRGFAPGGVSGIGGVLILVVWLYGTLALGEGRAGQVIMLLGSVTGLGILILHMSGKGLVGGRIAHSDGVFLWVWTLLALGVTSGLAIVLAARGLWTQWREEKRSPNKSVTCAHSA